MFKTNPILLKDLLNDVETGKIRLPDFQRGWVWDDVHIRNLIASVSKGFHVGAILTLEAGGEIKLRSRMIEGAQEHGEGNVEAFLLDGQQRLTSLYLSLKNEGPVCTQDYQKKRIKRWYYIDMMAAMDPNKDREDAIVSVPENKMETRDFGREIVRDLSTPEKEYGQHMMPTERLLNGGMEWLLGYVQHWQAATDAEHPEGNAAEFFGKFNDTVVNEFAAYSLPVINLSKDTPKEAVCTVFEKVNTGGVILSMFELVTASFAGQDEDFSLRLDWDQRKNRMYGKFGVLQGVRGDQFLQAISLLATQQRRRKAELNSSPQGSLPAVGCRKNDMLGLNVSDYHEWADRAERGFEEAAKFLHGQCIFTKQNVPYNTQLVPLAALFVELGQSLDPAVAKAKLGRWFWSGIFGEVYGSAIEARYALDLVQVAAWVRGGPEPAMVSEASFTPARLVSLRTRTSAAYKGLYALQMKSKASDWRTATLLAIDTWHHENIDIHHIFPVAWCGRSEPKVPRNLFDSIINTAPIDGLTNKRIGGKAPSEYLKALEGDHPSREALKGVLKSHKINPDLLYADDFAELFVERGEAMLDLIGQAMEKEVSSGKEVFRGVLASAGLLQDFQFVHSSNGQEVGEYEDEEEEFDEAVGLDYAA